MAEHNSSEPGFHLHAGQPESVEQHRQWLGEAITAMSSRLVGTTDIEDAIRESLADIGRLSGADRVHITLYNKDNLSLATIYNWSGDQESPQFGIHRNTTVLTWPWWNAQINEGKLIAVRDTAELPPEAANEKKDMARLKIKSVLALPLRIGGQPAGFISFDNPESIIYREPEELNIFKIMAEIIGTAFERHHTAAMYSTLINDAPMGIYMVQKSKFIFVNPEFQRLTGYTEAELLGKESLELVHPDDRELVVTNAVAMLKGTRHSPYDFRLIRRDGETIWAMETASSIQHNGMRATLGFLVDISRRRATIQSLRDSEEKLRSMFEYTSDGITIVDLEGTITDINEKALKMHGFKSKYEIIGKKVTDFVLTEKAAVWENEMPTIIELSQIEHHEMSILKADGSYFVGEISNSVCRDAEGNPTSFVFITRDVTERKQAEAALALKTALLEAAAETTIDGILAVNSDWQIILSNRRFQEMFQIPQTLLDAGDYFEVRDILVSRSKDPDEFMQKIQAVIENLTFKQRYEFETKEGRFIDRYSSPMLDNKGQYYGRINYYRDITEQVNSVVKEQQLHEEINRASRLASIGEMAAGIAHEINNPLTSVMGFTQLMLGRDISDDLRSELTIIEQEARRIARIVEGMLTFARGSQTGDELVDINQVISQVLEMRAYQMKINDIQQSASLAEGLPLVKGNNNQLKQVFLNIVLNAEKEMSQAHGQGNLTVQTEKANDFIRVSITDDGPGIPPENLEKIFDPFFTTSEVGGGTGLGLSICHGIVTAHQGKIYARSQVGQGTTLVVELPLPESAGTADKSATAAGADPDPAAGETPGPSRPARVLIVDDEPLISDLLERVLSDEGFEVVTANTAPVAVEKLNATVFDLVLMDIKMPLMNGMELYNFICKLNPKMAHKVIFITGDILEPTTSNFFSKYGLPYIPKPIDFDKLDALIKGILAN